MQKWYIIYQGKTVGPMTAEQLAAYSLNAHSQVWHEGMADWMQAYNFPELMEIIARTNPPHYAPGYPPYNAQADINTTGKDHVVAGLLAIFLGGLGIHYFYIGKTTAGILCILLTLVTLTIWSIISFIQGIVMLTQSQQQFEEKYVLNPATFPIF